jgi:hypothetical protein
MDSHKNRPFGDDEVRCSGLVGSENPISLQRPGAAEPADDARADGAENDRTRDRQNLDAIVSHVRQPTLKAGGSEFRRGK